MVWFMVYGDFLGEVLNPEFGSFLPAGSAAAELHGPRHPDAQGLGAARTGRLLPPCRERHVGQLHGHTQV